LCRILENQEAHTYVTLRQVLEIEYVICSAESLDTSLLITKQCKAPLISETQYARVLYANGNGEGIYKEVVIASYKKTFTDPVKY
jgi:hypothetical protein